jgi:hypothetical protein
MGVESGSQKELSINNSQSTHRKRVLNQPASHIEMSHHKNRFHAEIPVIFRLK